MPSSWFRDWFCSCFRSREPEQSQPDERTPLIPPTDVPPNPTPRPLPTVDHQKLKERLGTIVRAKGGKMVDVNAHVPFNLHHKAIHAHARARLTPSQQHARTPSSAAPSASPSPYASPSRSTTSLPPSALDSSVASLGPPPPPPLDARLIDGSPVPRGRSRTRRSTDDGDGDVPPVSVVVESADSPVEHESDESFEEPKAQSQADGSPTLLNGDDPNSPDALKTPQPSSRTFKIQSSAPVARSWGD